MTTYLCNAFSTSMLNPSRDCLLSFEPISLGEVRFQLSKGYVSAVGHPATATVLSSLLEQEIVPARLSVSFVPGDTLVVAQIVIPRLPEGVVLSKEEIEKLPFLFWMVRDEK